MKKIALFGAGAALCVALLAGCGSAPASTPSTPAPVTSSVTETTPNTSETDVIGEEKAIETAKSAIKAQSSLDVGELTVTKCVLDTDDGQKVYEIELVSDTTKYEIKMSAVTSGGIIEQSQEKISKNETTPGGTITKDEAVKAAKKAANLTGGTVTKNHFDNDDGRQVYEIEITDNGTEYEFEIDAVTGKILEQSQETHIA